MKNITYKKQRRKKLFTLITLSCLILISITYWEISNCISLPQNNHALTNSKPDASSTVNQQSTATTNPNNDATNTSTTNTPDNTTPSTDVPEQIKPYDYSSPVPDNTPVENSFFDDAVFIGDSRTESFILYTKLANTTSLAKVGLNVSTVLTKKVIAVPNQKEKLTVLDALAYKDFKKVYLMFGINELGWIYPNIFQEKYEQLIDAIKKINPQAQIYVQSIIPMSKEKSAQSTTENNPRIAEYNQLLQAMAAKKEVYFVNVQAAVIDEEGCLPTNAATDGIHLNVEYSLQWLEYLKTHTVS